MRKMGIKYSRFHPVAARVKEQFINVHSLRDWTGVLDRWYGAEGAGVWRNCPTDAVDLAIFVDVYHECDHPYEIIQGVVRALKPGGRLVFVEYRGEEEWVPIKPLHKMTEAQVRKEMALQPLQWTQTLHLLPRQHVIEFRKELSAR